MFKLTAIKKFAIRVKDNRVCHASNGVEFDMTVRIVFNNFDFAIFDRNLNPVVRHG